MWYAVGMATIDSQRYRTEPRRRAATSGIALAAATFVLLALPFVLSSILAPRCEVIFRDFGVSISAVASAILSVSHMLAPALMAPLLLIAGAGLVAGVTFAARRRPWIGSTVFFLALAFCVISLTLLIMGLFLPTLQMVESIQWPGKK